VLNLTQDSKNARVYLQELVNEVPRFSTRPGALRVLVYAKEDYRM